MIFIFAFTSIVCAQLKPFIFTASSVLSINDTTNNYYVSTTGTDTASGTYANPFSIAKADTFFNYENKDSVFYLSGTYDTTFTARHAGVTYCAYDLNNKPIIFGADTISGSWSLATAFTEVQDTFYMGQNEDDARSDGQDGSQFYNASNILFGHGGVANSYGTYDYMRFRGLQAIRGTIDSCFLMVKNAYYSNDNWIFNIYGDKDLTPGVMASYADWASRTKTNAKLNITVSASWGIMDTWFKISGLEQILQEVLSVGEITDFGIMAKDSTASQGTFREVYSYEDGASAPYLVVQYTYGTGSNVYKSPLATEVYGLYVNGILASEVIDASLVVAGTWCQHGDTLYTTDTLGIEAVLRDGIILNDSCIIAGFDIRKCRYGVYNSGTDDVEIGQSFFTDNIYGIYDIGISVGRYRNNVFYDQSLTNFYIENKDSAMIYNNVFAAPFDADSTHENIHLKTSLIKFKNNIIYAALPKIAVIDNQANINSWDYNTYAYYYGTDGLFLKVGTAYYDSLTQWQNATSFDVHSIDVSNGQPYPLDGIYFVSFWNNFGLRDSVDHGYPYWDNRSPCLNAGTTLPNIKYDFIGNPIPDGIADMGAYERVQNNVNPVLNSVSAFMTGDSARINWTYLYASDLDSARIYVNGTWIGSVSYIPPYYHHPAQKATSEIPTITTLNSSPKIDSAVVNFALEGNNDTVYYSVKWKLYSTSSYGSDSTTVDTSFIFIPQPTNYSVRLLDEADNIGNLKSNSLAWDSTASIDVVLTNLTQNTHYSWKVFARNDNGWIYSDSSNFTTNLTGSTNYASVKYITNDATDDLDAIDDTLTYATITAEGYKLTETDTLLFEEGKTYTGKWKIETDATVTGETDRIYIGTYGSSTKPIITTKHEISNSGWAAYYGNDTYSPHGTVWVKELVSGNSIDRLWASIDGVETELKSASCQNLQNWYMENLLAGDNGDGTYGVNSTYKFFHDRSPSNKLYIYSPYEDPGTYYSSISIPGEIGILYTVVLKNADYITIDGLDIQGGMKASLGFVGSDYDTVRNCNIGKNTNWNGIDGQLGGVEDVLDGTSDYIVLHDDSVNSYWDYDYIYYTQRTPKGIFIEGGASNWDVYDCTIIDWWFNLMIGSYQGSDGGLSQSHSIHDNDISGSQFSFSKVMQIESSYDGSWVTATDFYNNYCHDVTFGIQIMSADNKFYYNIFSNIRDATNSHSGVSESDKVAGGIGFGLASNSECQGGYGTAVNNYIFNNTFYNLTGEGTANEQPYVYNNLYLNTYSLVASTRAAKQWTFSNYKNNLVYKSGSTSSSKFFYDFNPDVNVTYSVAEFNALGGTISGNIYPTVNGMSEIMNTDFTLPSGSEALNAGTSISAIVGTNTTDRWGNAVNETTPHIGAWQGTP